MAHEIDTSISARGSAMFAYAPAWHGLGTVVTAAQSTEDALRIAGLDWTVDLCPLKAELPDGTTAPVTTHRATYRTDTGKALGAVGMRYEPLQNRDAFQWMDDVVGERLAIWETCGSLRGGRQVWMLAKLPGELEVTNKDLLKQYVLITNNHDGLGAVRLFPTSVRVVCMNTLRLALHRYDAQAKDGLTIGLKLLHTKGSLSRRVERAKECLGVIGKAHEGFSLAARTMMQKTLKTAEVADYFGSIADGKPEKSRMRLIGKLWETFALPTNEGEHGSTAWTAYNAASEFADHSLRVNGTGLQRTERKFASALFGSSHAFKERAWDLALSLTC
jgi:phage/plasmid-like protein (TIGR03299 family)